MKANSKLLILMSLVLCLVLVSQVFAADDFIVSIDTLKNQIYPDDYARFNITITNTLDLKETFTITSSDRWLYNLDKKFVNLDVNESQSSIFSIKPLYILPAGKTYNLQLEIESILNGAKKLNYIPVYLKSYDTGYKNYVPSLNLYADYEDQVDPTEGFKLKLRFRNRNALDIQDMIVEVNGDIFYKEFSETLSPQQEKAIQVNFDLDPYEKPGQHPLEVKLIINNKTYASLVESYTIKQVSDIQVRQDKSREFLRTIYKINAVNKGNIKSTKSIEMQKNWLQRLFLRSDTPYEVAKVNEKAVVKWTVELESQEETNIIVSNNYRVLFAIILIILIVVYLYYNLRSELIVKKKASVVHSRRMEGTSRIKIKLFIKNRTSKKLHNVEVREKISKLTELVNEKHSLGSLKPSKIVKGKTITLAKWHFEHLDPYEERIITYKLDSKLKLVGSVQFPRTTIKFKDGDGKICRTGSNKPTLSLTKRI